MPKLIYYSRTIDGVTRTVSEDTEQYVVPNNKFYQFAEHMVSLYGMEWSDLFIEDDELAEDYDESMVFVKRQSTHHLQDYLSQFTGLNYAK